MSEILLVITVSMPCICVSLDLGIVDKVDNIMHLGNAACGPVKASGI